uniref:Fe2OG dioxygenase domain-containing protein n=1 Tax=Kalanchoe fedtschenkoi TaxID=63787 RepID=A0A7N0U2Q1_KALFE
MDPSHTKFGGSLKVVSVQELAKERLAEIPLRYIRPGLEPAAAAGPELQVPLIDMQKLLSDEFKQAELLKLHTACADWGFFQIINHGVSDGLLEELKRGTREFFKLPAEEKQKFEQLEDEVEGYGQMFVTSEEQKLDWADMFYVVTLPTSLRRPHLLPKLPLTFREAVEAYSLEVKSLARKISLALSESLEVDPSELEESLPELAVGLTPHSDSGCLTILLEVTDQSGLEIRKDGKLIPIRPMANAFVVNVGDVLEILSNGAYRSIEHRAVVNSEKERLSIATFMMPGVDGVISPAPSLVRQDAPARFKRIGTVEYFRRFFSKELEGKSHLENLKI